MMVTRPRASAMASSVEPPSTTMPAGAASIASGLGKRSSIGRSSRAPVGRTPAMTNPNAPAITTLRPARTRPLASSRAPIVTRPSNTVEGAATSQNSLEIRKNTAVLRDPAQNT